MAGARVVLVGVARFERELSRRIAAAELATRQGASLGGHLIERNAKQLLGQNSHKKGTPTPSAPGEPPAVVTGTLRRSIKTQVTRRGVASYQAEIGPTVIYGRAQELGAVIGGNLWFEFDGHLVHVSEVTLPARPFMQPAVQKAIDSGELESLWRKAWGTAWRGGR